MYYTGPAHKELNEALRKGKDMDLKENPFLTTDQFIKTMYIDEAIAQYELERPMRVYRAVDSNVMNKCLKNGIFTEHAYLSTSCYKYSSILYRQNTDFLIIDIPKGKGIGAYIADYSAYPKQYEFLIKREAKFKIKKVYEREMNIRQKDGTMRKENRRVIKLEIV